MSVEIIYKNQKEGVSIFNLESGHVYFDHNEYLVMNTDEEYVVRLQDGFLIPYDNYDQEDQFYPVDVKIEVH